MRNAVPVEYLLLLLCSNAVVLVEEIEERTFWLFESSIGTRFEVAQVGKDTFFEFFRVLDRTTESLETESQAANNVGTGDVVEITPAKC